MAASSGLLFVLVFPKFGLFPLSGLALVPLLMVATWESSPYRRFLWGFLAGSIFFAGTCYWIYAVMRTHGGLGIVAASAVFVLFFTLLAVYWGLFGWLAGYFWKASWGPVTIPFLWVAIELLRSHLFSGFPWLLLGYAATDYFPVARIARWTGVYGLSYLLVSINVAIAWLCTRRNRASVAYLIAHATVLLGFSLTPPQESYAEDKKAFLVQTNIPQETGRQRWDLATQTPLLNRLEELTRQAVGRQEPPALVIWPEMPAPFYFWDDSFTQPYAQRIAHTTNSYFLMGIVAFAPGSNRSKPLNSQLLLGPGGNVISQYDKIRLVPFGEYVPLKGLLSFADKLTAEAGDFVPGDRYTVSALPGVRIGGFICYEAIFPNLVREFVRDGAEVLINTSNDGWFGSSAARDQHLLMARMRAIENARYLLRTTNTGITAVIRPDGSVASQLRPDQSGVLEGSWSFQTRQTFYSRNGDWFAFVACLVIVVAVAAARHSSQLDTG